MGSDGGDGGLHVAKKNVRGVSAAQRVRSGGGTAAAQYYSCRYSTLGSAPFVVTVFCHGLMVPPPNRLEKAGLMASGAGRRGIWRLRILAQFLTGAVGLNVSSSCVLDEWHPLRDASRL
jgi:hypothetical protein